MNIGGISGSISSAVQPAQSARASLKESEQQLVVPEPTRDKPVKGVVRLLEQGHFKGVADVRLRINFNEELTQQVSGTIGDNLPELQEAFSTGLQSALASLQAEVASTPDEELEVAELSGALAISVNDLFADIVENQDSDLDALGAALQSEADNFAASLQSLLDLDAADTSLEAFSATFATLVADLSSALTDTLQALPETSEPNGNGVAYAKFVEILEGLQQQGTEPESVLGEVYA